jgi:inner membrane protein
MPSPLGHSLTGAVICAAVYRNRPFDRRRLGLCVLGANLPDVDFLPGILIGQPGAFHNGITHSLGFLVVFAVIAGAVAGAMRWGRPLATAGVTALLVGSHLLLDMLMRPTRADSGIPLWWPISDEPVRAPLWLLLNIERTDALALETIRHNIFAVGWEAVVLGGILLMVLGLTRRRSSHPSPGGTR